MQVGTGRSILNGIAIGKLKIYKKKDTVISTAEIADTAAEVARFEAAQQKAIEQQTALYEKALAEAGEDIAEVFNIHAMMLEDDDFVDAIKEIINGQHKCAEYAVKTAGDNQAAVFAAMDDPYLQARSADVIDIAQAILDILQGVDNASLQGTEPSILVAEDLAPSETVRMDKSLLLGFITREGSSNSHTANKAKAEAEKKAAAPAEENGVDFTHEEEIDFDTFCKVELRVAEVRACENLKESKKLLHLTVFDGERERCILSGIAKWFKPEDLIGKKIGIVCNLAPRPMMKGKYVSEGMIFAADTADGGCSIAFYGDDTPVGSRIH